MRPSSMLTVRLQVSGQSKVQTLARSSMAMGPPPYCLVDTAEAIGSSLASAAAASVLEPAVLEPNPLIVRSVEQISPSAGRSMPFGP
jgi:hypothetical protein